MYRDMNTDVRVKNSDANHINYITIALRYYKISKGYLFIIKGGKWLNITENINVHKRTSFVIVFGFYYRFRMSLQFAGFS